MAVTNFLVSSLPNYVQENKEIIVANFALAGVATRGRIGIQTGVKSSAHLTYLDLAPTLQDGSGCGFNPLDSVTLSARTITCAQIKVDGEFCPKTLLGKYGEWLVRVSAVAEKDRLPFEKEIMDALVRELNKKIEKLIWLGDTSSNDADIKWIDGFIAQFGADNDVIDVSIASGTTAYDGILATYMAMPQESIDRGGVIFVGPEIFRSFLQDMVKMNYYHFNPGNAAPEEFMLPGTNVKVFSTPGLAGNLNIVGTFADNLVYGTDGQNDEEDVDLWFSKDDRKFKYTACWNSGVAYHFPAQVVLGTFAATPTPATGINASLAALAVLAGAYDDQNNLINVKDNA